MGLGVAVCMSTLPCVILHSMPKRTSKRRKDKATEWTIGQPLRFPPKVEIREPSKRPLGKTVDKKRSVAS
jgi:hypothetical protein